MELYWKAAAGVLLAAVLGLTLSRQGKDLSVVLSMAVCCMTAGIALHYLAPVLDFIRKLETMGQLQGECIGILLKALGVGLISRIVGTLCTDAGNAALGQSIQLLGSSVILCISLPVFTALLDLLQDILGLL